MTNVEDAIGAIVDFNFNRNFSQIVAKSVDTRSYAQNLDPNELKFEMLNSIVVGSGLSSIKRSLGGHPEYNYLTGDMTKDSSITTMFADLRNFTRYGLFLPNSDIRTIKRAVISSFIQIVHAFDGHVHNIPGDGLMVYFGGEDIENESLLNSVIAGSSLIYALKNHINPLLAEIYGFEEKLHMRVGIEFGQVLWGQYGVYGVEEVKATGFSVDFAAKIQQIAETDQLRTGEGIYSHLGWPQALFSDTQTYERQFKKVRRSARHFQFDWAQALRIYSELVKSKAQDGLEEAAPLLENGYINPRMQEISQRQLPSTNQYESQITAKLGSKRSGPFKEVYTGKRKLPKNWWIKFTVSHNVPEPFDVEWEVINNGYEAFTQEGGGDLGHINNMAWNRKSAYESTAYSGTHYMVCRILKNDVEVSRSFQVVMVK